MVCDSVIRPVVGSYFVAYVSRLPLLLSLLSYSSLVLFDSLLEHSLSQHFQRSFLVFNLIPLVLILRHNPSRNVNRSAGRVSPIHMLSSRSLRSVILQLDILQVQVKVHRHFRHHHHNHRTRMHAPCFLSLRDSLHFVDSSLMLQHIVRLLSLHPELSTLQPSTDRHVFLVLELSPSPPLPSCQVQVHPVEVFRKERGLAPSHGLLYFQVHCSVVLLSALQHLFNHLLFQLFILSAQSRQFFFCCLPHLAILQQSERLFTVRQISLDLEKQ